jgi:PncC family amidohydrolase
MTTDIRIETSIGKLLTTRRLTLAVAESCTGGLLGHRITSVSGSSEYFLGGIIAYSNKIKISHLGVQTRALARFGAVSREVARQMAMGVRKRMGADIGLSITGIAGPDGGTKKKPVGLVFIGLAYNNVVVRRFRFKGNRLAVKTAASRAALEMLRDFLVTTTHGE